MATIRNDIGRLRRHFPAVPVKIILIDVDPPPPAPVVDEESPEEQASAEGQDEPAK